ncbi:MAG: carbonic anhydrase [Acidobacteriota bacterium]
MSHIAFIEQQLQEWENWVFRRQKGIPNNKRLFVLACMDERLPVEQVLGLEPGDAHVYRNAGGLVTDDVIRSAALTTNFFNTEEIIVVTHTECGMLSAPGEEITRLLGEQREISLDEVPVDPTFPEWKLNREQLSRWWRMQTDIDEATVRQVEALRSSPLIPDSVRISGYVYEVETGRLRRPNDIYALRTRRSPGA